MQVYGTLPLLKQQLVVVADFDRTLTKAWHQEKPAPSSLGILRASTHLPEHYRQQTTKLAREYLPYEKNRNMDPNLRSQKMQEWWEKNMRAITATGVTKNMIDGVIAENGLIARPGVDRFYDLLAAKNIPLLVFSAGCGDIIVGHLQQRGKLTSNVHVVANFYCYDDQQRILGYSDATIHCCNKHMVPARRLPEVVQNCDQILLLGDALEDIHMASAIACTDVVTVGLLNSPTAPRIKKYQKVFDIVLAGDGSLVVINEHLQQYGAFHT